jgi:hypothetical protein
MKDGRSILIGLAVSTALGVLDTASTLINVGDAGKAMAATASVGQRDLTVRTNSDGGVTVSVNPKNISAGASSWDFEVTLNTHTVELNQDLQSTSVLIDAEGKPHAAVGWEGDPPGGHHRKGVLRFKPITGKPQFLELRISGVGGVELRVFRWQVE